MSTTIDNKVVEMRFDNKQFEQGVAQTTASVEKLKSGLNFDSVNKSDFSGISGNLAQLANRFTVIGEVVNSLEHQMLSFVASLTVGEIGEGWAKYNELIKSTQTIMAATRQEWSNQEAQMRYVNTELERLNWFTDETSFNLTDMTQNVGKFTSAGIDLETAVTAMEGIGTWAGISGANVWEMSRAMYNLSQALSSGGLFLRDWMSIENANMATVEFKKTAIATGIALGKLKVTGDGVIETLKGVEVNTDTFRSTLNTESGNWFDTDVLMSVLDQYGGFAAKLNDAVNETGIEATELMEYIDQYKKEIKMLGDTSAKLGEESVTKIRGYINDFNNGVFDTAEGQKKFAEIAAKYEVTIGELEGEFSRYKDGLVDFGKIHDETGADVSTLHKYLETLSSDYYELGEAAFKASQESKTWSDAFNYTKDAVSTGWANIFKLIVGNYLEAKELWTDVTWEMYDLFVKWVVQLEYVFRSWSELGGRAVLLDGVAKAWENIKSVLTQVADIMKKRLFPDATIDSMAKKLLEVTERFRDFAESIKLSDSQMYALELGVSRTLNILSNIVNGIKAVLKPMVNAFSEVFSDNKFINSPLEQALLAVQRLTEQVTGFLEAHVEELQSTFAGFMAVADIVYQFVAAIIHAIAQLIPHLSGADGLVGSVLDTTASFGEWLVNLDKLIKDNDIFGNAIRKVISFIKEMKTKADELAVSLTGLSLGEIWDLVVANVGAAIGKIKEFFGVFSSGDSEVAQGIAINISFIFEKLKSALESIKAAWQEIKPYIDEMIISLGETIDIDMPNWEEFSDGFRKGGALAVLSGLSVLIYKLIDGLEKLLLFKPMEILDSFNTFADGIGGIFESLQNRLDVATMKSIATAIVEIVGAIAVLAMIDGEKLGMATAAITHMFGELVTSFKIIESQLSKDSLSTMYGAKKIIKAVGFAMLEISAGIALIASQDSDSVETATAALLVIMTAMGAFAIGLNKVPLDTKKIKSVSESFTIIGFALIEVSAALAILASITAESEKIVVATIALGALFAVIIEMLKIFGESNVSTAKVVAVSASLTAIGLALIEMAAAIAIVVSVTEDSTKLAEAVGALATMLLALGVALNMMPSNTATIAAGLVGVGIALILIAEAVAIVTGSVTDETADGIASLVVILAAITAALIVLGNAKGSAIEGGAAITIASIGVLLLAEALTKLNEVNDFDGVIILTAALAALMAAAMVAEKVSAGLTAMGVAIALIGVGSLAAGAGVKNFAEGVKILGESGKSGMDVLIYGIKEFFEALPQLARKAGEAILQFFAGLMDGGDALLEGITFLVGTLLEAIILLVPLLTEVGLQLLYSFLDTVISAAPKIVEAIIFLTKEILEATVVLTPMITAAAIALLLDTLRQISENIEEVVELMTEIAILILSGFIKGIADGLPNIIEAAIELVIAFINGMAQGIEDHTDDLIAAVERLWDAIVLAFCKIAGINSPSKEFTNYGHYLIEGLINGISEMIEKAKEKIAELANKILEKVCEIFGIDKPDLKNADASTFVNFGLEIVNSLINGVDSLIGKAKDKIKELAEKIFNAFCEKFGIDPNDVKAGAKKILEAGKEITTSMANGIYDKVLFVKQKISEVANTVPNTIKQKIEDFKAAGKSIIDGLVKGIEDFKYKVSNSVASLGSSALAKLKSVIDSHSPSKKFAEIGKFIDLGLVQGIDDYSSEVFKSTEDVGNGAIDSMSSVIDAVIDMFNSDMDAEPTIRPVLDLSDVSRGIEQIDGMMSTDRSINLASASNSSMNASFDKENTYSVLSDLKDMINGITKVKGDTNNYTFNVSGDDPHGIAEEVSRIIQEEIVRRETVWE